MLGLYREKQELELVVFSLIFSVLSLGLCSYPSLYAYKLLWKGSDGGVFFLASAMGYPVFCLMISLVYLQLSFESVQLEVYLLAGMLYFLIVPVILKFKKNSLEDLPGKRKLFLKWCSISLSLFAALGLLYFVFRSSTALSSF